MTTIEELNDAKRIFIHELKATKILDKGHVKLANWMGDDLDVANAARASFEKENLTFTPGDEKLINFLIREDHTSPFRHANIKFSVKAPLMIARQHWKYVVGSDHAMDAWNEASRRYVTSDEEMYLPEADQWRGSPDNKKQGSAGIVEQKLGEAAYNLLASYQEEGLRYYKWAMAEGICAEQARLFLPAYGLYVTYIWSASLQSVLHFLNQRLAHDAQKEIQDLAQAVFDIAKPLFPVTFEAFGLK